MKGLGDGGEIWEQKEKKGYRRMRESVLDVEKSETSEKREGRKTRKGRN